jgi:hypothetical protein
MNTHTRWVGFALLCVSLSGCGESHAWSVYGISESDNWVEQIRRDGGVVVVLAADCGSKGISSSDEGGAFHGTILAVDGRKIPWKCDIDRGTMVIDGQKFDLAHGNVFRFRLESTVLLEQVVVNESNLQAPVGQQLKSIPP